MNIITQFKELSESVISNPDLSSKKKFIQIYSAFKEELSILLIDEKQYFPSKFSELIFLLDRYNLKDNSGKLIKKYFHSLKKASKLKTTDFSDSHLDKAFHQIIFIIESLHGLNPKPINFSESEVTSKNKVVSLMNVLVSGKVKKGTSAKGNQYAEIIIDSDESELRKLILLNPWVYIFDLVNVNDEINLINVSVSYQSNDISLIAGFDSVVVIEPDYLIDVTDISECFQIKGPEFKLYFIKRFIKNLPSISMLKGNLVNSFFDDLISNPDIDYNSAYENAIKNSPLQLFLNAFINPSITKSLKVSLEIHFLSLRKQILEFMDGIISVEPSFISPEYGIQGRLDAMVEYDDEIFRKNVIELKSGRPPDIDITVKTGDSRIVRTGVWPNHLAQTSCYNLLLKSAFENRSGVSSILYSSAESNNLRNVPDIPQLLNELIHCRNSIVAYEKGLLIGDFSIIEEIISDSELILPGYMTDSFHNFSMIYGSFEDFEMDYFRLFTSFIINEIYTSKIGVRNVNGSNGFSSLWKDGKFEKELNGRIIPGLKLQRDKCDFTLMHFVFSHGIERYNNSSFRKGDIIILYPDSEDDEIKPFKMQLLKGHIKDIGNETLTVGLRNKLINTSLIEKYDYWIIEFDSMDTTNKKLLALLFEFLSSETKKKSLLFGLRKPELQEIDFEQLNKGLNSAQKSLLDKALNSKEYFLIQGPPGTGKTSYMLRSLVENIYHCTNENILVLAYTNRAVDEICSSIKNSDFKLEFLRMGSKESTIHIENLLFGIIEKEGIREAYSRFIGCRVIVSTLSSVIYNSEIMEMKNFDTVIIDEASQILEPQIIGILCKVKRFIMIGDDKQLPAVVVQGNLRVKPNNSLKSIFLNDPKNSLFERLVTNAKTKGWTDSFGMLNLQARMHENIMEFPNRMFYENRLKIFNSNLWQNEKYSFFKPGTGNKLVEILSKSRVIFIESKLENKLKFSSDEVQKTNIILNLINEIIHIGSPEIVGVISPYRMQCSEIARNLPKDFSEYVNVDTVERFQGSEREIIIFSFATNNEVLLKMNNNGNISKKLNVAITRAKKHLIIFGNSSLLSSVPIYSDLINYIKSKSGYINLKDFNDCFSEKN